VTTKRTILVTGATGTLGVPTTAQLREAGHDVRALSRRTGPGLVTGDLLSGAGLTSAMDGVGTIVHLATGKDDVRAVATLLDEADRARVGHLVLISIVGIDDIPLGYYTQKREVERLVSESDVPHTILRATQFHSFVERLFTAQRWVPVVLAPAFDLQPIAVEEVARRMVELAGGAPAGRVPDIGGPARRPVADLAAAWAAARGVRRPIVPLRLPGKTFEGYRAGHQLVAGPAYGVVTFEEHLAAPTAVAP
jgi:uncharacterized protein YbjT (DUF2867 family)